MTTFKPAIVPLALFISGCAITGPADDGFTNSQESIDIGKVQNNGVVDRVLKKATGTASSSSVPSASE